MSKIINKEDKALCATIRAAMEWLAALVLLLVWLGIDQL